MNHLLRIMNDAGLFREYLHDRGYAADLLYGGLNGRVRRTRRLVQRLARLAGISYEAAKRDVIADYKASPKWN